MVKCYFCGSRDYSIIIGTSINPYPSNYECPRCGHVYLEDECAEDIGGENFTTNQLRTISIFIRNEWEQNGRKHFNDPLSIEDLQQIIEEYHQLDPLEQMNDVLLKLDNASNSFGSLIEINLDNDFTYYRCHEQRELSNLLVQLSKDDLIDAKDPHNPQNGLSITTKGYEKIKKLKADPNSLPEKQEAQKVFQKKTQHDAYVEIKNILQKASSTLFIVDGYMDSSILMMLGTFPPEKKVQVQILSSKLPSDFDLEARRFQKQYSHVSLEIRTTKDFHDRFITIDKTQCYHLGASIKDAGNKVFMISQIKDQHYVDALIELQNQSWDSAKKYLSKQSN